MSRRCVFCTVGSDLYLYKYYLDSLCLQEVNTDAFYSALKQVAEPDGQLRQFEGVADFGTSLDRNLIVECQLDSTLLPTFIRQQLDFFSPASCEITNSTLRCVVFPVLL